MWLSPARRVLALLLAGALAAAPVQPQVRLPALGDSVSEDFDVGTERRLGERIMREVWRDAAYLDDPLLLEYVQSLWQPLLAAARARGDVGADVGDAFAWQVFLVRDRSVNAFALPGGYVGVHLGLIAMTGSRDELASVLAHELVHVTQRHIARSIANSSRQSMVGMAAMLLGLLAASRAGSSGADVAQAAIVGSQAAVVQGQLNFSRDMEREADRIGFGIYGAAGFAPAGAAAMFEKLAQAHRLNDGGNAFPYLRSHPLSTERIGEARARLDGAAAGSAARPRGSFEHAAMQARARVLMDTAVQSLRRQQAAEPAAGASDSERYGVLVGSAMASLELREPARAHSALAAAQALLPRAGSESAREPRGGAESAREPRAERQLALMQAQAQLAAGEAGAALAALDRLDDGARRVMLLRAQAALELARTGRPDALRRSAEALQGWVTERRSDALAWSQLALVTQQQGQPLRALRAEAEARAAQGDIGGALDRLRAAQRVARSGQAAPDFIESSVIDTRVRELDALQRALLAEARERR
jgi:predicted Zn-dependent protease